MTRCAWGIATAVAVGLLAGCSGGSFESDDQAGYEACQLYASSAEITDDPLMRVGAMLEVGNHASEAKTDAIRDAAEPVGTSWLVDHDTMETACEANGVDIP